MLITKQVPGAGGQGPEAFNQFTVAGFQFSGGFFGTSAVVNQAIMGIE